LRPSGTSFLLLTAGLPPLHPRLVQRGLCSLHAYLKEAHGLFCLVYFFRALIVGLLVEWVEVLSSLKTRSVLSVSFIPPDRSGSAVI